MRFHVLGPIEVTGSAGGAPPPGSRQRRLLSVLLAKHNLVVSRDRLVEVVWDGDVTESTYHTLAVHISNLRKRLQPLTDAGQDMEVLETVGEGYRLHLEADQLDAADFERLVRRGRSLLDNGDPFAAAQTLARALELWRGPAFGDAADLPLVHEEAIRLDESRLAALETRLEARLELGDHTELVAELEALVAEHPLRETFWSQLMLSLYRCDRQAEALAAFRRYSEYIGELGLEPSANLQRLEDQILLGDPGLSAPAVSRVTAQSPPAERTRLVGRSADLDRLGSLLDETRLLTLTGTGGVGKTRLAQSLAWSLIDNDMSVWWVDLAGLTDADRLLETVAAAGGIPQGMNVDLGDMLASLLAQPPATVIVLDTAEHLVSAAARLVDYLLDRVPTLRFIVTSREPLQVGGETVWNVESLSFPEEGAPMNEVREAAAVQLFLQRAESRGTSLAREDLPAVAEVCRRLDGIPLAIELAAARAPTLAPHGIVERLNDRFSLLGAGMRTALPRHRTLEGAIDWSYQLLEENDRRLLSRLSVFKGPFDLKAAGEVCGFDQLETARVEEAVQRLVDQSMIDVQVSASRSRLRLLESIREFAWDRLDDDPQAMLQRHRDWAVRFAERGEQGSLRGDAGRWTRELIASIDDFRAAWQWSLESQEVEPALVMAAALQWPLCISGRSREAEKWIAHAKDLIDGRSFSAKTQARVALVHGVSRLVKCDLEAGRQSLEEAQAVYLDLEHIPGQYWTEYWLILLELADRRRLEGARVDHLSELARAWSDDAAILRADWLRLRVKLLEYLTSWPDIDQSTVSAEAKHAAVLAEEAGEAGYIDISADSRGEQAVLMAAVGDPEWLSTARQAADGVQRIGAGHQYAGTMLKIAEAAVMAGSLDHARNWLEVATRVGTIMDVQWAHTTALRIGASAARQQGRATLKEDLLGAAGDEAIMPIGMVLSDGAAPGTASTATFPAETLWEAFEPDGEDRHTDGDQC